MVAGHLELRVFSAGGRGWLVPAAARVNGWAKYEAPGLRDLHPPSRFCRGKGMCLYVTLS